uniref:Uncharacterized protein n=1 Tax=Acrobeloides nanus TaxID=290746 RepID=A0A914CFX1_9BILA
MLTLLQNDRDVILGAINEADLVLSRGAGDFDVNYEDPAVREEIGQRKICDRHLNELSKQWHARTHWTHYFASARASSMNKIVCSIPESIEAHTNGRPVLPSKLQINKNEARAILLKEGLLVHIGLPVCSRHKTWAERTSADVTVHETGHFIYPPTLQDRLSQTPDIVTGINFQGQSEYDPDYCPPRQDVRKAPKQVVSDEICNKFYDFAYSAQIKRVKPHVPYQSQTSRTKRYKSFIGNRLIDYMTKCMAPDAFDVLKEDIIRRNQDESSDMEQKSRN